LGRRGVGFFFSEKDHQKRKKGIPARTAFRGEKKKKASRNRVVGGLQEAAGGGKKNLLPKKPINGGQPFNRKGAGGRSLKGEKSVKWVQS